MLRVLSLVAAVCGLTANAYASEEADVVKACLETVHKYAVHVDSRDAAAVAALFTEDAELVLPSRRAKGTAEIKAGFEAMPATRRTIHHVTTALVEKTGDHTAKGTVYLAFVAFMPGEEGAAPTRMSADGIYSDDYHIRDGVCRFSRRKLDIVTGP